MKKLTLVTLFLLMFSFGGAQNFTVDKFTADYYLQKDGYFDVVEQYDVNFLEESHGLLRKFMTKFDYKNASGEVSKREIYVSDIETPNQNFTTNELFGHLLGNQLQIKIGEKDKLVSGLQHYEIRYRVKNSLFFNNDIVEFYWNVKSAEWFSPFLNVSFTVHAPDGVTLSSENCFVYSGGVGNNNLSDEFTYKYKENRFSAQSGAFFSSSYNQAVTVLVKLPRDTIQEIDFTPPITERYKWLGIVLGVIGLIIVSIIAKIKSVSVTPINCYYPPENIDSALAGALIDDVTNPRDVQSLLPYWGANGYIKMEEISKEGKSKGGDLKLTKIKDLPANSPDYQLVIFRKLFLLGDEVYVSTLKNVFAEGTLLLNIKTKEFYKHSKSKLKTIVAIISILIAFSFITWIPFVANSYTNIDSGGFVFFIIFSFLFFFIIFPILFAYLSKKMRSKTTEGKRILGELYGFKNFIKLAETERLKFLLKEDPFYFEKTMPYAVAFNLLGEWTEKFEGLFSQTPEWYSSSTGSHFTMRDFASSMGNSISIASATMVSSTYSGGSYSSSGSHSSSGGGFSGGGSGSGGGGSW